MKNEILGNKAEQIFHRGTRTMGAVSLPIEPTPGFKKLGRAVHGYEVEVRGDLFAISSKRLRTAGWYRIAVLAKMTKNGHFRVVEKEVAEKLLPSLENNFVPPEKPKKPFTGELKAIQEITIH